MFRHVLLGFLFVIFSRIFSYLFYGLIFNSELMKVVYLYRIMESWQWALIPFIELFIGIVISVSYSYFKKFNDKISSINFCLYLFLITRFVGEIFNYATLPSSVLVMLAGMLSGLFSFISMGFAIQFIKPKK